MKKVFYFIVFIFVFTIFGINKVDAKELCYYKTDDEKITMAVVIDNKGTAYLMKPYSKSDGFIESQNLRANWEIKNLSSNGCSQYLLFDMNSGNNYVYAYSTKPTAAKNEYVLTKFNAEQETSTCIYKGPTGLSDQFTFTVKKVADSLFYYFENNYNSDNFVKGSYWTKDRFEFRADDNFFNDFSKSFNESNRCPLMQSDSTGGIVWLTPNGKGFEYSLISEEYADEVDVNEVVKTYEKYFQYEENQADQVKIIFRTYEDTTEELCIKNVDTFGNKSSVCANISDYKNGKNKLDKVSLHINFNGKYTHFYMEADEIYRFFQYDNDNEPSTLKDPGEIYFDKKTGGYKITKNSTNHSSEHLGLFTGETYKQLTCELSAYLKKLGVSDYKSLNINGSIKPLSQWGCTNTYTCSGDECQNMVHETEQIVKSIRKYCNDIVYKKYVVDPSSTLVVRMNECISFNEYYAWLVENNYISNLGVNCELISNDFAQFLINILNIVKIAGPILAIILGMLDFIKVIVSGDPDKENKKAFTSLTRRLMAAVLLFLIPVILSFIMNLFLTGQEGYDQDNPFCGIDWSER